MRHPVKLPMWLLVAATLAVGFAAARPAAAQCSGFRCVRVSLGCRQCVFQAGANSDCVTFDECSCANAQCAPARNAQEALRRDTGIVLQPAVELCSVLPRAATSAPLPF